MTGREGYLYTSVSTVRCRRYFKATVSRDRFFVGLQSLFSTATHTLPNVLCALKVLQFLKIVAYSYVIQILHIIDIIDK